MESWLKADDALTKTLEQETAITVAMMNGDPGPKINSWESSDDITLFGAWGPIEKGHKAVTDTMQWVGSRFTGADSVNVEHTVIASSGDLAYTVGFERCHVSVGGGPMRDMVIRVTHIYRRSNGDWKLTRRHADFPPADQRATDHTVPAGTEVGGQSAAVRR